MPKYPMSVEKRVISGVAAACRRPLIPVRYRTAIDPIPQTNSPYDVISKIAISNHHTVDIHFVVRENPHIVAKVGIRHQ
jgi:hypothetical protein